MQKNRFFIALVAVGIFLFHGMAHAFIYGTIREVETNQTKYVDNAVKITGKMNVTTRYIYGSGYRPDTHFAFKLTDETGTAYVYVKKGKKRSTFLRNEIIATKGPVAGDFIIKVMEDNQSGYHHGTICAELLMAEYEPGTRTQRRKSVKSSGKKGSRTSKPKIASRSAIRQNNKNSQLERPVAGRASSGGNLIIKIEENEPVLLNRRDPGKVVRTNQEKVLITQENYSEKISSWVDKDGKINFTNAD